MKKLLTKLVNYVMNKKMIDLDNDGKIETLREEVSGLFSQFKKIYNNLDAVNEKLEEIIQEEELAKEMSLDKLERVRKQVEEELLKSDSRIGTAFQEKEMNNKMKERVSDFIV